MKERREERRGEERRRSKRAHQKRKRKEKERARLEWRPDRQWCSCSLSDERAKIVTRQPRSVEQKAKKRRGKKERKKRTRESDAINRQINR